MSLRNGTAYKVLTPLKCIKTQPFNKLKSSRKKVTEEQQPDQTRDAPSSARDHPHIHKGGGPRVGLAEGTTPKLSKAGQQRATAVGQEYERMIIAVDNQAIRNVSNVYREYGIDFERPPLKSTVVGPINIPLAVTGTANAAGQTTMPKDGVIKIASIEVMAKDEVKILCGKAGSEIQEIHKAEGLEVRAKGTSKVHDVSPLAAIGAANLVSATAAAGLSSSGQKRVKAVQDVTGAKIADVDRNAIEQIASVYKDNDIEMTTPRPRETAIGIITAPLITLGALDTVSKTSMDQREVAKIAALEVAAKAKIRTLSERAEDEVKLILGKEGVSINQSTSHEAPPPSVATALSCNGVISRVGAAGLAAAVAAAGLSKSGQKKVASIEKKATKKISGIDSKAMKDIANIYYVNGLKMEKPLLSKETRLGPLAVHLAVVGASAAASTANMPANEVERVSIIENAAKAEIDSISDSAEKSINAVLDKEGVSLDPPGSSREPGTPKVYRRPVGGAVLGTATVGAAAVSGLSKAGQKKAASVETKATAKILAADERAMKEISAIYKANGKTMEPSVPTEVTIGVLTVPLAVLGASSTASQDKLDPKYAGQIAIIEVAAKEEIKSISDRVEEDIRTIALSDRGSAGTKASSRDTSSSDETSSKGAGAAMAGAVAGAGVAVAAGIGMLGRKKQTSPEESDTEENRAIARGITSTAVSANKAGGNTNRSADDAASVQTSLTPATVAGAMSVAGAAVASGFGLFGKKTDDGFKSGTTAKEPLMASSDVSEFAPLTSTTSRGTRARAAQIGAAGLIGAATGAGLSKSGVKKVKSVEKKAIKKITSLDNKAVKEIASVYRKGAKKSLKSTRNDTSIGVLRVPLCVIGASVAASQAGLEEHEIGQIAAIELDAKEEIRRIDRNASDEIKGILEGEGISFDCRATSQEILAPISPTTSRSTGFGTAAATSGVGESQLSKSGKRKAAAIDKKMAKKIAAVDDIAMKEVAAVYLEHAIDMEKPVANDTCVGALSVPLKVFGASDAATEAKMDLDGIVRISDIESEAKTEIHKLDDVAFMELSTLHKKEGKRFDRTPRSVPPGKRAVIAGVAVGAVTAGGAAVGSLFKSNEAKISNAEEQARQRIVAIDTEAMKQISSIYQENGLIMKPIISRKAKVGVITVPVGVIGAGTAARKTTMGSLDLGRIASIERRTTDEIESIDRKAAKDIAVLNEKQGRWFADRPGASRAAGIAAEAGLGIKAVKKIAAIEEAAEKEIEDTDNTTAQRIAASDKKHDLHMHQLFKKNMEAQFRSEEEETAATRYFNMQERAADEIALIDEDAENDIRAVYKKNGRKMNRSNSDYFTKRGAAGPTATIAAVAMTAKLARLRRKNLRASRSSASPLGGETQSSFLGSVGSTTHLALYDAGSFVARVGSALTGTDLEGPAQYDARAK